MQRGSQLCRNGTSSSHVSNAHEQTPASDRVIRTLQSSSDWLVTTPHVLRAFLSSTLCPGTDSEVTLLSVVTLQPSSGLNLNEHCRLRLRCTRVAPTLCDHLSDLDVSGNFITILLLLL